MVQKSIIFERRSTLSINYFQYGEKTNGERNFQGVENSSQLVIEQENPRIHHSKQHHKNDL